MHFLSHYYTELPNNNPLFVVALGIPDILPGFTKIYNTTLRNISIQPTDSFAPLHQGIARHFAGDATFHDSVMFKQQVQHAISILIESGLDRKHLRLSVLAHLAVEMLIDRQIISQQPHVCNEYYLAIGKADESVLNSYFIHFGLEKEKEVFLKRLHFFRKQQFLYHLHHLENMVMGLNRIYSKVTKVEFSEREKAQLKEGLYNIDNIIRYRWQEILSA